MSKSITNRILFFIVCVFAQVLFCSNINFLGYINPYVYLLFIIYFPVQNNRISFLFFSFLIGLVIDMFSDSGGIHAAASVSIAYIRPLALKFSFGALYEYQSIKFNQADFYSKLIYTSILVFIHHFILFSLEIFNFSKFVIIFQKTIFSSIFTTIICVLVSIIFSKKET